MLIVAQCSAIPQQDAAGSFQFDSTTKVLATCDGSAWRQSVKVGDSDAACDASTAGLVRFGNGVFDGCDGLRWFTLLGQPPSAAPTLSPSAPTTAPTHSPSEYVLGRTSSDPAATCDDILQQAPSGSVPANGLYWIKVPGWSAPYQLYCDFEWEGGGWTLVTRQWLYNARHDSQQRTFFDWMPCFSQPWPGFSFP